MSPRTVAPADKPEPASFEQLLTINDVAGLCRLSARTITRLILSKQIAAYRVGNRWRISRRDFALFLRDRWRR